MQVSLVRADALPGDRPPPPDTGCEAAPLCTECPLAQCRYDVNGGIRAILRARRDREIYQLHEQGSPVEILCERFGLSRRSLYRVLEKISKEGR